MTRDDLQESVAKAISANGGAATIVEVAQFNWKHHEADLRSSGELFYTWQYDMRWAAQRLRDANKLVLGRRNGKNVWQNR